MDLRPDSKRQGALSHGTYSVGNISPVIISDPLRVPVTAELRKDGGVLVRGHFRGALALSESELTRLIAFARNEPRIQRFPAAR